MVPYLFLRHYGENYEEGGIQYKLERQYDGIVMVVYLTGDAIVVDKCSAVVMIDTMYVANSTNCDQPMADLMSRL